MIDQRYLWNPLKYLYVSSCGTPPHPSLVKGKKMVLYLPSVVGRRWQHPAYRCQGPVVNGEVGEPLGVRPTPRYMGLRAAPSTRRAAQSPWKRHFAKDGPLIHEAATEMCPTTGRSIQPSRPAGWTIVQPLMLPLHWG